MSASRPEDPWTGRLAAALRDKGFNAEGPSPVFHLSLGGEHRIKKPDIAVYNGMIHILSAKVGMKHEIDALVTAQEYSQQIGLTEELTDKELGEVFAVVYPAKGERNFILHILARTTLHDEIPRILTSFEELVEEISKALRGEFDEVQKRAEPTQVEARRLLRAAALNLGDTLRGIPQQELEKEFGGHHFFRSVLAAQIPKEQRPRILRLGAAFLFVNQVLFYSLLSRESERKGDGKYASFTLQDAGSPEKLQVYFDRVREQDYEPVYGIKVSQLFKGQKSKLACKDVATAIMSLSPKLRSIDLAGQVFQSLIPLDIRKPLGAHYTNPNPAALLAACVVETADDSVMDPACGSGTLLVASYKRKLALAKGDQFDLHRKFVEEQITGIDAMAFSGHLAAVNLAIQQPLKETDHVRIGTTDSTLLRPRSIVPTTGEALPSEFHQTTLEADFDNLEIPARTRTVRMRRSEARGFAVNHVDVVIMNPPFTSWDNMDSRYRDGLAESFSRISKYRPLIYFKPSQQLFFLFLADIFLNPKGRVGAVLPLTTFTAKSFHPFLHYFLSHYSVHAIFLSLGRAAYSEDTSLTECLLVASKQKPAPTQNFVIIGTRKPPDEWTEQELNKLVDQVKLSKEGQDHFSIRRVVPQQDLLPESRTLSGLYLSLLEEYDLANTELQKLIDKSTIPLIQFGQLTSATGIEATECVFSGKNFSSYGPKALIISRTQQRSIKQETDRLFASSTTADRVRAQDRVTGSTYEIPTSIMVPAIRRFSYLKSLDVSDESDFCVAEITPQIEKLIQSYYARNEADQILRRLRKGWSQMVTRGSSRLLMMWRVDWAAKGTTLICVRHKEPAFMVIKGKYFTGISNSAQEKFLCLWFNSSPFIVSYLGRARITRGTYMDLEEYALDRCPVPDISKLAEKDHEAIGDLWQKLSQHKVPSLLEQLASPASFRDELDDGLLGILGISDPVEQRQMVMRFQKGAYSAINALANTMRSASQEKADASASSQGGREPT